MRYIKVFLVFLLLFSSLASATAVYAYPSPGPYGTPENTGYFLGNYDTNGDRVLPQSCAPEYTYYNGVDWCNSVPNWAFNPAAFTDFIRTHLVSGLEQERTGGAFIIQTMIGAARDRPPTAAQVQEFVDRVNAIAPYIVWGTTDAPYNINSRNNRGRTGSGIDDIGFYDVALTNGDYSIVFKDSAGNVLYTFKTRCGNPVGQNWISPLPPALNFSMRGFTNVQNVTSPARGANPVPGDQLRFHHFLHNDGPTVTTPITWIAENMEPAYSVVGGPSLWGTFANGEEREVYTSPNITVPIGTAAGTRYCQRVGWDPINSSGGRDGRGALACATVAAAYDLVPIASNNTADNTVEEGENITFTFSVDNNGSNDSPTTIGCSITGSQPSGIPAPPAPTCNVVFTWNGPPVVVATQTVTITNQPPGGRICRTLTVNPATPSGGARSSSPTCVTVVKTPYVHFMGGDVWAGGGFVQPDGSCTTNVNAKITTLSRTLSGGGGTAGSTVEYAAFALHKMTQFGSSSKAMLSGAVIGSVSRSLSFANTKVTEPGEFAVSSHCIDDYATRYESAPTLPGGTYSLGGGSTTAHVLGNMTIQGNLPGGSQQVYLVDGDVTISDDIRYIGAAPNYSSIDQIPSLVVIAKGNIFVSTNADELSGIFIARNTFYTCYPKPAILSSSGDCSAQLVVNGAVKARQVDLYRTFGAAGPTAAERKRPAEQFNLSPEMFIRNALNNTSSPTIFVSDSRELPPRF